MRLDASKSWGLARREVAMLWVQRAGPEVELSDAETPVATFVAPETGDAIEELVFELVVATETATLSDQVSVTVDPAAAPAEEAPSEDSDQPGRVLSGDWAPPIGIPAPSFGIHETAPARPNPWNAAVEGFYYVDNSHPEATDSGNPNGHPGRPRETIPNDAPLPAGSVVEVHGGPYNYSSGGVVRINAKGTASKPVFILGVGMPRFDRALAVFSSTGVASSYLIMEGLDLYECQIIAPADHIVLRHSEVRGDAKDGGVSIASWSSASLNDIVIYANAIHDNGDWRADHDQDVHGVSVTARVSHTWILDNELYHNSGDGVQINAGPKDQATTHHIYVGGNLAWENKQTGFWTKQAVDVIFSENTSHSHFPVGSKPSASGAGMGYQYGPERVWFLYNHIYNCAFGIQAMSTSGLGTGQDSYFVGNLIHDIHHHPGYAYNPGSAWSNAGMMLVGTPRRWIVNNTIYNVDAGINGPSTGIFYMANNIIDHVAPEGNHVFLENPGDSSLLLASILGEDARVAWGSSVAQDLLSFEQEHPQHAQGTIAADPMLVNPQGGDFRPDGASPAVGAGAESEVYATFESLYGLDISPNPDGGSIHIGAYGESF